MSKQISNTKGVTTGKNTGKVGSENQIDVQRGLAGNTSVGDVSNIKVSGENAGGIGSKNTYDLKGGLGANTSVGNTENVTAGTNSGDIGSGNKITIG